MKGAVFFGFAFLGFAVALGCKAYPTYRHNVSVPIDCDVDKQYRLDPINAFDTLSSEVCSLWPPPDGGAMGCPGWTSADSSPGALMTGAVVPIPDGPRCDSTAALLITGDKNHDWGSLFGYLSLSTGTGRDAEAYEGLSFWARAGYNTNTAFTILLDDPNTSSAIMVPCGPDAGVAVPPAPASPSDAGSTCRQYCNDGGTGTGTTEPGTGMIIPGTVSMAPEPDQCGNSYTVVRAVTEYWRFYTIPFSEFLQTSMPNRVPNKLLTQTGPLRQTGLRTKQLVNLIIRFPKAVRTELWIDNLGFYGKPTAPGDDGGVDAP